MKNTSNDSLLSFLPKIEISRITIPTISDIKNALPMLRVLLNTIFLLTSYLSP
jgi:riboflavin synthase